MKIIDLAEHPLYEPLYFVCLEEWSGERKEAGDHKRRWYEQALERGLRVKLAVDDAGVAGAMIQYLPIEQSLAEGSGLYFIKCVWVHGHKRGRGDFRRQGMGPALLRAAEDDARGLGAAGMAAWGVAGPFWMRASWFRRHGYQKADRNSLAVLLWKPFLESAAAPRWIRQRRKPQKVPGQVTVTAFINGWCPAQNLVFERARHACAQLDDPRVVFEAVDTSTRQTFLKWGISDDLFIDGKSITRGPPLAYETIRKQIQRPLEKLR